MAETPKLEPNILRSEIQKDEEGRKETGVWKAIYLYDMYEYVQRGTKRSSIYTPVNHVHSLPKQLCRRASEADAPLHLSLTSSQAIEISTEKLQKYHTICEKAPLSQIDLLSC